ncbi:sulfotransferase family protein, partial [Nodularia spumigena]|uniref:sulfotransferase family protein n=1 Tax=Nodularia spumigena TaxID=70799 RepID=UPI002B20F10F
MPESKPHFVIIGAMKCATTTLHDQLALQPGVFMSEPKEPNFFSDEVVWGRGLGWYQGLFADAGEGDLCGESSTHYTKLPTHPFAAERLFEHLPHARLVYVMRDPIDRLVSHYIHEWSRREIDVPIDEAVRRHAELIDYSRYAMQLAPWIERFRVDRVLPVFFERLTRDPQGEFTRVCRHIGYSGEPVWHAEAGAKNVSAKRTRYGPMMEAVLSVGAVRTLRRTLLPEAVRERIKSRWRMEDRPRLSEGA